MNISDKGVQFICNFEGFKAHAYPDPATKREPFTIGYGTTAYPSGKKVTMQDPAVTKEQAAAFIRDHVDKHMSGWLNKNLPGLKQHQFDALCSFVYNLGLGNLQSSSLLKSIKVGAGDAEITANFNKWTKAAGKVMAGLVRRRAAEANMYCKGVY